VHFRRVSAAGVHESKRSTTLLQQLVRDFRNSLQSLGAEDVAESDLETWAILIFESMSASSRVFHSVHHVFDVSEGMSDPVPVLAAFFHDVIYYSIDGGLTPKQFNILSGIIQEDPGGVVRLRERFVLPGAQSRRHSGDHKSSMRDAQDQTDSLIDMIACIFDFKPGQVLNPFKGLNEFLSAACAVRCLRHYLPLKNLAAIAACIEATIPFRKPDEDGNTPPQLLYKQLKLANEKFEMEMTEVDVAMAVQDSCEIANRDLRNFAQASCATFLSNTWNLMHESNIDLRHTTVYSISYFAVALKKMCGFFQFLDATTLYASFKGVPSQKDVDLLTKKAQDNIDIACRYLQAKLLSISVLSALAELTGGDAPIALFLGDLPEKNHPVSPGIEDFIQPAKLCANVVVNDKVYRILEHGREGGDTQFDLQNSPLAAYLYGMLGEAGMDKCLEYAVCPMTPEDAKKLLDSLPREAVVYIAKPCAILAESRKAGLKAIIEEYSD